MKRKKYCKKRAVINALVLVLGTSTMAFAGELDLRTDIMSYKPEKSEEIPAYNEEVSKVLSDIESAKQSGEWNNLGISMSTTNTASRSFSRTTPVRQGQKRSITQQYKNSYKTPSKLVTNKAKQRNFTVKDDYVGDYNHTKLLNDNFATQFDITSSGYHMTPNQWKAYIKYKKPYETYSYTIDGKRVKMKSHEMYAMVVDAIYQASEDAYAETGITICPDVLVALSIHETGWGSNRISQDKNGWFSVGSINSNPYGGSHTYSNPYNSARGVIKLLTNKYVKPGQPFFDDTKGPTLAGANTMYCVYNARGKKSGVPSLGWALKISDMVQKSAKYNKVRIPLY